MRKQLYMIILVAIPFLGTCQPVDKEQIRSYFIQATQRRSALDSFAALVGKKGKLTAYEECYLGICEAMQIQYVSGMWSKCRMLDISRDHINEAIARAPQDAEIHFMRFMLEHNIPAFLGMSGDIRSDLAFVFDHSDFLNDSPEMKMMAMKYMLQTKRCSREQTAILEKNLDNLQKKLYASR